MSDPRVPRDRLRIRNLPNVEEIFHVRIFLRHSRRLSIRFLAASNKEYAKQKILVFVAQSLKIQTVVFRFRLFYPVLHPLYISVAHIVTYLVYETFTSSFAW